MPTRPNVQVEPSNHAWEAEAWKRGTNSRTMLQKLVCVWLHRDMGWERCGDDTGCIYGLQNYAFRFGISAVCIRATIPICLLYGFTTGMDFGVWCLGVFERVLLYAISSI